MKKLMITFEWWGDNELQQKVSEIIATIQLWIIMEYNEISCNNYETKKSSTKTSISHHSCTQVVKDCTWVYMGQSVFVHK